ncbi:hypothetical protein AHF37_08889 [Paragonimus kellicotti]|nr:hypothetical protein AHF37_08889 [Paragonimus kellicotti]
MTTAFLFFSKLLLTSLISFLQRMSSSMGQWLCTVSLPTCRSIFPWMIRPSVHFCRLRVQCCPHRTVTHTRSLCQ